jgi:hypothetical protein
MNLLCKIGLHKWGSRKQWLVDGIAMMAHMCLRCGKTKKAKS